MDEYELVHRTRELRSRHIMTWGQVMLSLSAAIVAFFVTQAHDVNGDWNFSLLFIGWLLFTVCIVYWRYMVHHIDGHIVELYPIMLALEKRSGWETQTRYYYNNLSRRSLVSLRQMLGKADWYTYEDFVEAAGKRNHSHYELLLDVWRMHGRRSVGSRGHAYQDLAVLSILTGLLVTILWIKLGWLALFSLLLLVALIPLGSYYGWWEYSPPSSNEDGVTTEAQTGARRGWLNRLSDVCIILAVCVPPGILFYYVSQLGPKYSHATKASYIVMNLAAMLGLGAAWFASKKNKWINGALIIAIELFVVGMVLDVLKLVELVNLLKKITDTIGIGFP